MHFEVERKFRLSDAAGLIGRLAEMRPIGRAPTVQVDCYYAHPQRDFAQTDEALRIRRVGNDNFLTYKGPRLDHTTKTRQEVEVALASGEPTFRQIDDLLTALGFRAIAEVRKTRRQLDIAWEGRGVHVAVDHLDELGDFVELELLTSADEVEAAKASLSRLAEHLGLSDGERRSYLELLLERRRAGA